MVGRYSERRYQLAAQKHNESFLKYNYYQQAARYFERECRIARHYDSWNLKDLEFKDQFEKARKTERLHARRNKLRILLKQEEDQYRRELEELKRRKTRAHETVSLDALREKLKEKRAEESLYLPRSCRRYQSYFFRPSGSAGTNRRTLEGVVSPVCTDSTNFIRKNDRGSPRVSSGMSQEGTETTVGMSQQEEWTVNPRYLARYAHRSLENTNVRNDQELERHEHVSPTDLEPSSIPEDQEHPEGEEHPEEEEEEHQTSVENRENMSGRSSGLSHHQDETDFEGSPRPSSATDPLKDPSDKMLLYLRNRKSMSDIEELAKKEMRACTKHSWDDALRFRDIRNRLELIRAKSLYGAKGLDLDEEVKKLKLEGIDKREEALAQREIACANSVMYNEDARALWEKWVREDEQVAVDFGRLQREAVMNELEKEWDNLAIRDKERISRTFQNAIIESSQEEHKLVATLSAAAGKPSFTPSKR